MTNEKLLKYMAIAETVAQLSKDSSTKVGAIILGQGGTEIRSLGYNGAPRGSTADTDGRCQTRPEKYFWVSHAEQNAIVNAARVGTPLAGGIMLVTHPPCMDCARAIVQAGIKEVYWLAPTSDFLERWREHLARVLKLFAECGVYWAQLTKGKTECEQ